MFAHAHRHLPYVQRPHTRCPPYIPCFTHTRLFTHTGGFFHTYLFFHTRGDTHTRCFTHTGGFAHACHFPRTRGSTHTWCSIHTRLFTHTRGAGKHAPRHTRDHTTHTRGCTHTFHHTHRDHTRNHWRIVSPLRLPGPPYPQALRAPVNSTRPLKLARHDRTHLVVSRLKGEYSFPSFPKEATPLPAPGPNTLCHLAPIVLHYLCVCVFVLNPV